MKYVRAATIAITISAQFLHGSIAAAQVLTPAKAASDFGAREAILDASLSPDGSKVALVAPSRGQGTIVLVYDLKTGEAKPINAADGKPLTLTGCGWVSNQRLLCTLYGVTDRNYGINLAYSRMVALDIDGTNAKPLAAIERQQEYAQQSDGYVLDWRDGSSNKVLLGRVYVPGKIGYGNNSTGMAEGLGVDLIDTATGKVEHVESADPLVRNYIADGQGNVRMKGSDDSRRLGGESDGNITFRYRLKGSSEWKPFSTYSSVTDQGMYPVGVDGVANVAYVLQKLDGRDALYRVALDGTMKTDLAYAHPRVDVGGVIHTGRAGRIVGASYTVEANEAAYFDPQFERLMRMLAAQLPTLPMIHIIDSSADGKTHLIYAASATDAGRYLVFDPAANSIKLLADARPQLHGIPMGEMKSVTYRAGDGTEIPAYLTLPPGGGKNLPAIVMPHGGPAARDSLGFDWLVQFYVNRGYAVLQPNFRGSTGYGEGWFLNNGFKSWRVAIGDVNDAGKWLVASGVADPTKLAIVGWSYGGYAALQSNVLDPGLFKAVVAIAPVTDLGELRGEKRGFTNTRIARDYIGDGPHIEEGSPARHASRFQAPVILFHGKKDINVAAAESELMHKALKRAGKQSELILYPDIDHQLRDSAIRADMLAKSDEFLAKALQR